MRRRHYLEVSTAANRTAFWRRLPPRKRGVLRWTAQVESAWAAGYLKSQSMMIYHPPMGRSRAYFEACVMLDLRLRVT